MNRKCLQCNTLIRGRTDKKFCDHLCRNAYNNAIKRESEKNILEINRILRRNRKILKQFNPEGKTTVRSEYLKKMGFDFRYITHVFTTKNRNTYRFCYEFGYLVLEEDKILIINEQDYMKR